MISLKDLEETASLVAILDGGHNKETVAFVKKDGSFGGCCSVDGLTRDKRYSVLSHKITTLIKYTRWKYGLIESNDL